MLGHRLIVKQLLFIAEVSCKQYPAQPPGVLSVLTGIINFLRSLLYDHELIGGFGRQCMLIMCLPFFSPLIK
jgi:hypothetical protein